MAKIKCETKEESTLIKFEALEEGEVFLVGNDPCVKLRDDSVINAISLLSGLFCEYQPNALVTYVKSAELKLTI